MAEFAELPEVVWSERLTLRRPRTSDSAAVFALEGDVRTACYRPAGPLNRSASDADLTRNIADWRTYGLGYWIVEWADMVVGRTGQRIIDVPNGLLPGVTPERLLNTYYRFSPDVWGTGVPTEAALAALNATLASGPPYPVVAITSPDNAPSQRMAVRLGMSLHRRVPVPGLPDTMEFRRQTGPDRTAQ
ncbi:GNAT family N-acetyltransferase [Leekyejoonella antrihumi]|uniref:GNAT family N-acetyltransferase n=1 Tax=Leekyejoonella antrihumi TaxID=1660198 RepID=A0A563E774_9MICO|nr:GNAT family N-acetyltransferase [Leekyejoonella antrihumi]TWP38347.1 GNAT family N-acetyltransferase [Leekyejoonella antrihumi]